MTKNVYRLKISSFALIKFIFIDIENHNFAVLLSVNTIISILLGLTSRLLEIVKLIVLIDVAVLFVIFSDSNFTKLRFDNFLIKKNLSKIIAELFSEQIGCSLSIFFN